MWNKVIRLSSERWNHIIDAHPEMKPFKEKLVQGIAKPDRIYYSDISRHFIFIKQILNFLTDNLIIFIRTIKDEAFVMTGHPISKKRLKRKESKWKLVTQSSK